MIVTLWIFIISGLAAGVMVGLKMAGVSGVSVPGWNFFRTKTGPSFEKWTMTTRDFLMKFHGRNLKTTSVQVLTKAQTQATAVKTQVYQRSTRFRHFVKGRRDLSERGRPSRFLNEIKESKDQPSTGAISDDSVLK